MPSWVCSKKEALRYETPRGRPTSHAEAWATCSRPGKHREDIVGIFLEGADVTTGRQAREGSKPESLKPKGPKGSKAVKALNPTLQNPPGMAKDPGHRPGKKRLPAPLRLRPRQVRGPQGAWKVPTDVSPRRGTEGSEGLETGRFG